MTSPETGYGVVVPKRGHPGLGFRQTASVNGLQRGQGNLASPPPRRPAEGGGHASCLDSEVTWLAGERWFALSPVVAGPTSPLSLRQSLQRGPREQNSTLTSVTHVEKQEWRISRTGGLRHCLFKRYQRCERTLMSVSGD